MSIERSMARGFALVFAALGTLAMGCAAGGAGSESAPAQAVGAAPEAFHDGPASGDGPSHRGEGRWWRGNVCPGPSPVHADAAVPPHAFPGPCEGQENAGQAIRDGAEDELQFRCRDYCGQSGPECAARAGLLEVGCVDREIGHVWKAICGCDS